MDSLFNLTDPCFILLVGKPKSGKSYAMKYIVYELCAKQKGKTISLLPDNLSKPLFSNLRRRLGSI